MSFSNYGKVSAFVESSTVFSCFVEKVRIILQYSRKGRQYQVPARRKYLLYWWRTVYLMSLVPFVNALIAVDAGLMLQA
jgi:hypothetical protein